MNPFVKSLLLCFSIISIERFCRLQTGGFRFHKAAVTHTYPFKQISGSIPTEAKQPFYYLASGVQSYVFIGKDRETILKLFKHHHFGPSSDTLKKILPQNLSRPLIKKREKRMLNLFSSAQIAYGQLQEKTGVFYLHLGKTNGKHGKISLFDKLGICYDLDLDQTEFILQRRAETAFEKLHKLFKNGQTDEAISSMKDLLHLIEQRSMQGIKNKDGNILENCGFFGRHPLEIDVGSFIHRNASANPQPHKKAVLRATLQLLNFVKKNYPEELPRCKRELIYENII